MGSGTTGGIFSLITNNGKQDRILSNTDLLNARLREIARKRAAQDPSLNNKPAEEIRRVIESWMPTLQEIEQTHIIFVNKSFKPFVSIAHEYSRIEPRNANFELADKPMNVIFPIPIIGDFINDAVLHIKLDGLRAQVDGEKVRYAEMLGHRLVKKAEFRVQTFVLDSYGPEEQNVHYNFKVTKDKEAGYLRSVGQEIPKLGYLTADPLTDNIREYKYFGDGAQTFKTEHVSVEMWIPMLFWFREVHNALPNFILPMQQTDISITLESFNNLIAVSRNVEEDPNSGNFFSPRISVCEMYANHIYLLEQVRNIYINKFNFQLIRVHRQQTTQLKQSAGSVLLHNLKWPIECMYVAFRPLENLLHSERWHRYALLTEVSVPLAVVVDGDEVLINTARFYSESHCVSQIGIQAHGIDLYPDLSPSFYNSYIPYQYGTHCKTPYDAGWYMINFNLKPGEYQPSGHYNSSLGRELYLKYVSEIDADNNYIIRDNNPVELVVVAECINFLLFQDNNVVLRFST
jgi:hypothetical protein